MESTISIKPIDISVVETENKAVAVLTAEANALVIKNQDDYVSAGELRARLKGKIKRVEEIRKGITVPLDNAKKAVMALFNPPTESLNKAVSRVDELTIAYDDEQQRKAQEEQDRLNRIAEKKRLEAQEKAKAFAEKGNDKKAEEWLDKASTTVAPTVEAATPKVNGQGIKVYWYGEVVDFKALPDEYKVVNQSAIDKVAGALKDKTNIPGVVIKSRKGVMGRAYASA